MSSPLNVTPDELRSVATEVADVSSRLKEVISSLNTKLAALGSPWGNDSTGSQFANGSQGYLAQKSNVDSNVNSQTGQLDSLAQSMNTSANNFEQQDSTPGPTSNSSGNGGDSGGSGKSGPPSEKFASRAEFTRSVAGQPVRADLTPATQDHPKIADRGVAARSELVSGSPLLRAEGVPSEPSRAELVPGTPGVPAQPLRSELVPATPTENYSEPSTPLMRTDEEADAP